VNSEQVGLESLAEAGERLCQYLLGLRLFVLFFAHPARPIDNLKDSFADLSSV